MAATAVTFGSTSPITGVALAMTSVIPVAAGVTLNYVYRPSTSAATPSTGRGAQFYVSTDGLNTVTANLVPLIVKWEDRAAVQGYCNPQWAISVTGPIDIVIDKTNDMNASYFSFA
jgi:hypothetical protein